MARTGTGSPLLSRRDVRLDAFLKRNTERSVYERIRAHEPCVVVSERVNKVFMHAVLSDERVYLTEHPPRTLAAAVSFGRVRDIELVNDLPDFLRGKARDHCQHVRITYVTDRPAVARGLHWLRRDKGAGLPHVAPPPSRRSSHRLSITNTLEGYPAESDWSREEVRLFKPARSASCPNPETLGLLRVPHPPARPPRLLYSPASPPPSERSLKPLEGRRVPRRLGSVLSRLLGREDDVVVGGGGEEREAELHLYAVSQTSRLYLHLLSSWNSFIITSTLLLDPLYRRKCSSSRDSSPGRRRPAISGERTAHLFAQLRSELLQDAISVESLYLLLQELHTAAHRHAALRRLFWRSGELCVFLVQTLEESLHGLSGVYTADQLLLSTVIVQTLAVMFRETQAEAARLNLLAAREGSLTSRLLLAVICDPRLHTQSPGSAMDSELQVLLSEYLDAASSLLFELLLLGHKGSRCFSAADLLSVGWILRVLQPHPHLLCFVGHQARQVALVLSDPRGAPLSPVQSVLLFQRCRLLLACLQHDGPLAQHLRSHVGEEFRYFVRPSCAEEKLPLRYPISSPTVRLVERIVTLMLHR
ncbi:uncharacterized protein C12orf56 homolog isoform X3 [Scophthalmus maximus]|uniref:uncharacterized protein C12orf56 homolog isoform X3 n=1 Tax=Scophthalmus maximus TaxID=52904 RepID=UPI001FA8B64C|nr:uncharacterized protein C12orf56 homolog isoform X3 [Scophthalmus maximus]